MRKKNKIKLKSIKRFSKKKKDDGSHLNIRVIQQEEIIMDINKLEKIDRQSSVDNNRKNEAVSTERRQSGFKKIKRTELISRPSYPPGINKEAEAIYDFLKQYFFHPVLMNYFIKIGIKNSVTGIYHNKFVKIRQNFMLIFTEVVKLVNDNVDSDVYIAPVTFKSESGTKDQVNYVTALVADFDTYENCSLKAMDFAEAEGYREKMIIALKNQTLKPSLIIGSGNGLQVYWRLHEPLEVTDQTKEIEGAQKALASLSDDFKGDMAAGVLGHSLRLPGTKNYKNPDNVKKCSIICSASAETYNFKQLGDQLGTPIVAEQLPDQSYPETMFSTYQKLNIDYETLRKAAGQCEFLLHMGNHPDQQSYVLWSHLALNLAVFGENGRVIFHNISKKHSTYQQDESERHFSSLEEKVKDAGYKPTSCSGICDAGFNCPKTCQQKSPAGMILSTLMKANKQHKPIVEVDLEVELKKMVPKVSPIDNIRLINAFILDKLNLSRESRPIKIAYLKEAMKILGIPERGNLRELTAMIKVVSIQGGTGNFEEDLGEKILKAKDFIFVAGNLMTYEQGIWSKYRGNIRQDIINQLEGKYVKRVVESIEFYIKNKSSKPLDTMNTHIRKNLICLSNGMLQIDENGDFHLLPHQKEYLALNRLEIVFDPTAKCPRFLEFLNNCFCLLSDEDIRITIDALQEWFGYSLVPGNNFHRFVLLIGKTRTGKSVVQEVLSDMLGHENVSNIRIENLHIPINTINLIDKLINIGPEIGSNTKFNEEFFKSLTGGDGVDGRTHHKDTVSFKNGSKMMFSSNFFPKVMDLSGAFYERALCFPFDNFIPEEMRNIHLSEELIEERAGVLLWALQGRARLLKRGRFIESAAMVALKDKVKISNDPVLSWFETEKATFDRTVSDYTVVSWWNSYKNYCIEENQKQNKRSQFVETLKTIPGISITKPSTRNQECFECNWLLIDPSDRETTNNVMPIVTEVTAKGISPLELCTTVAVDADQDVLHAGVETNIISMIQETIQQQDDDWSAFN